MVTCNDTNLYGSQCTFSCDTGYQLVGNDTLTCESDGDDTDGTGEWDTEAPRCQGETQ